MRLAIRVSGKAREWLQAHPGERAAFFVELGHVTADELQVIQRTFPIVDPESGRMVRAFEFGSSGKRFIAVIQWKHAESRVRVVECRERV